MSTGLGRAACEGDIQPQEEGRFLLYYMLHGLLYSTVRNLLKTSYMIYYVAKTGCIALSYSAVI